MLSKESIAIFNPQHPTEKAVQDTYYDMYGEWLTAEQINALVESIVAYDYLLEEFLTQTSIVCRNIFGSGDGSKLVYVPCFPLELRQILSSKEISSNYRVAALGYNAAIRYFKDYPVLLVLDATKLPDPVFQLKGVVIYDQQVSINNALVRVLSRNRVDSASSRNIEMTTMEEYPEASVHCITEVPGIAPFPKAASSGLKAYRIHLPVLGIETSMHEDVIVKAKTPEDALQEILNKKWHELGVNHRDPQYTVEYWKQSDYWPIIVRKAESNSLVKTADTPKIEVNDVEQKIFDLILKVNRDNNLGLTFRCAGGWSRDKLLGKESDDIDIAIDKMTGAQFGEYLSKVLGKRGNIIKANPEQSKQLETLTMSIFGQDIDFVNLRKEVYDEKTRIPKMTFGTAQEDAERRDFTINSIFYNLNTGQVEDLTGQGLKDLATMTLRTPLEPTRTFLDDPLRVMRLLRFYSRYKGAQIDPAAIEAMKNQKVQEALKNKISKERIYTEWTKMMTGAQQSKALRLLYETGIWDNVLKPKEMEGFHPFTLDQNNPHHVDNVFDHTIKVIEKYDEILRADGAGDKERALALTAAFLHDLGKLDPSIRGIKDKVTREVYDMENEGGPAVKDDYYNNYHGHEDVSARVSRATLEALKASNDDIMYIESLVQNHMTPHTMSTDKKLRQMIRNLGRELVIRIIQHAKADAGSKPASMYEPGEIERYDQLIQKARDIAPSTSQNTKKPVINGQILMSEFPNLDPRCGYLRDINQRLQDAKDENPNLTDDQVLQMVRQMKPEILEKYKAFINMPKQAATWYEEMRTMGEQETIDWLCGYVIRRDDITRFVTDQKEFILRWSGSVHQDDPRTAKLEGKRICAKGLRDGSAFILSEFREEPMQNTPSTRYIERQQPADMTTFNEGDSVRIRRGLAFPQLEGKVNRIDKQKNLMYIRWNGVKDEEVYNLNDTTRLHARLEKI